MKYGLQLVLAGLLLVAAPLSYAAGDAMAGKDKSATCAACHGEDGNSQISINPKLAGQQQSYLLQALRDYQSGVRKNPIMSGMVAGLSDQDIQDLAAWFASQSGLVQPVLPNF